MSDKSVIIAIRPHWCELIAEGKKLVEVRKTYPTKYGKAGGFKCFIYCTQSGARRNLLEPQSSRRQDVDDQKRRGKSYLTQGAVIGEFICDGIKTYSYNENSCNPQDENKLLELSCLTGAQLYFYLRGKKAYAWSISDLVIYDKPRELCEFGLERPPQSWCYCL